MEQQGPLGKAICHPRLTDSWEDGAGSYYLLPRSLQEMKESKCCGVSFPLALHVPTLLKAGLPPASTHCLASHTHFDTQKHTPRSHPEQSLTRAEIQLGATTSILRFLYITQCRRAGLAAAGGLADTSAGENESLENYSHPADPHTFISLSLL